MQPQRQLGQAACLELAEPFQFSFQIVEVTGRCQTGNQAFDQISGYAVSSAAAPSRTYTPAAFDALVIAPALDRSGAAATLRRG